MIYNKLKIPLEPYPVKPSILASTPPSFLVVFRRAVAFAMCISLIA
jgi:hypothetical protein